MNPRHYRSRDFEWLGLPAQSIIGELNRDELHRDNWHHLNARVSSALPNQLKVKIDREGGRLVWSMRQAVKHQIEKETTSWLLTSQVKKNRCSGLRTLSSPSGGSCRTLRRSFSSPELDYIQYYVASDGERAGCLGLQIHHGPPMFEAKPHRKLDLGPIMGPPIRRSRQ